jgi:phage gp37-like protein
MRFSLSEIEDAILALLEPLKVSLGVRTVKAYQGELESPDFGKMIVFFPGIFLYYSGSTSELVNRRVVETMEWSVFAADRSFRGDETARRGGTKGVGTYALISAIADVLRGQKVCGGVLIPVGTESIAYSQRNAVSVYESRFRIDIMEG